jgi:hypothetical protein
MNTYYGLEEDEKVVALFYERDVESLTDASALFVIFDHDTKEWVDDDDLIEKFTDPDPGEHVVFLTEEYAAHLAAEFGGSLP